MIKTIEDVEAMMGTDSDIFGTVYNEYIHNLVETYTMDYNGKKKVKEELQGWDTNTRHYIASTIILSLEHCCKELGNKEELLVELTS